MEYPKHKMRAPKAQEGPPPPKLAPAQPKLAQPRNSVARAQPKLVKPKARGVAMGTEQQTIAKEGGSPAAQLQPLEPGDLYKKHLELMRTRQSRRLGSVAKGHPPVKREAEEVEMPKQPAKRVAIAKPRTPVMPKQPAKRVAIAKPRTQVMRKQPAKQVAIAKPRTPATQPPPHVVKGNRDPPSKYFTMQQGAQAPAVENQIAVQMRGCLSKIIN